MKNFTFLLAAMINKTIDSSNSPKNNSYSSIESDIGLAFLIFAFVIYCICFCCTANSKAYNLK